MLFDDLSLIETSVIIPLKPSHNFDLTHQINQKTTHIQQYIVHIYNYECMYFIVKLIVLAQFSFVLIFS